MFRRMTMGKSRGFTLIETLAALIVFSVMTLGIAPLIISSIRGSNLSRSLSVGRNLAVQAMERARGLPYHIKTTADPGDVDLLDFYFPSFSGSAGDVYTTTCASGSTLPACPRNIPARYTVVFVARFVELNGTTFAVPSTYDSNSTTGDRPPSLLLELTVRSEWSVGARSRRFEIKSLLADRKFGGLKVSAFGKINYGVSVQTTYQVDSLGVERNVIALGGLSESRIETRRDSRAEQTVRAARLRLVNVLDPANPDVATPIDGATSIVVAPPDLNPGPVTQGAAVLNHSAPLSGQVAGIDSTRAGPASGLADVQVTANSSQLPDAHGGFSYFGGLAAHSFWVHKPEIGGLAGLLRLTSSDRLVYIQRSAGSAEPLGGHTFASTSALPSGAVTSGAHVELRDLTILPTDFGALDGVVNITDFSADVDCRGAGATGSPTAPTARWQATLKYWEDPKDTFAGIPDPGGYVTRTLASTDSDDLFATLKQQNPMVHEFVILDATEQAKQIDGSHPDDVHLFPIRHEHVVGDLDGNGVIAPVPPETVIHDHPGYLSDWRLRRDLTVSFEADGRSVAASIEGAIAIDTVPIQVADPSYTATPFNISLGDLRCEAVDFR